MSRTTNNEQRTMFGRSSYSIKRNSGLLGFTLIEVLVVVAIIGMLASLTLLGLQGSTQSARNTKRKTDVAEVQNAVELYKSDCKQYPTVDVFSLTTSLKGDDSLGLNSCTSSNIYLRAIPSDPLSPDRIYRYYSDGITYEICASLEKTSGTVTCGGIGTCGGGNSCNFKAVNP